MDVMGRVCLAGGQEVKIVTGIDDHSRFIVCAKVVLRATARPVCQALAEALRRHGIPSQILTDNPVRCGIASPAPLCARWLHPDLGA
jgi:transposase InsO family protein